MEKLVADQLVIYENDAVLVSYTSGAGLQLAPCGTIFTYHHPLREGNHPLHGQKKVLQRTCYLTSTFKEKVLEALDFRNRFACRPYVLKELTTPENLTRLHADICDIVWPDKLHQANIQIQKDHSIVLKSLCSLCSLTLASSRQLFTVQYFCQVSQEQEKPKWSAETKALEKTTSTETRVDKMLKYCIKTTNATSPQKDELSYAPHKNVDKHDKTEQSNVETQASANQWDYALVTQHFSIHDCPVAWQHPLNLVLEYVQKLRCVKFDCGDNDLKEAKNENTDIEIETDIFEKLKKDLNLTLNEEKEINTSNLGDDNDDISKLDLNLKEILQLNNYQQRKSLTNCVFCTLPKALPENCIASHLHKWGSAEFWDTEEKLAESALMNGRIKVVCCREVIYRFLWSQPRAIEIYPGDGTVLRSSGLSGHFFIHYIYNKQSLKVEEQMYSLTSPPPDVPTAKYSINRLLTTGERFLRHLYEESLSNEIFDKLCCWKTQPQNQVIQQPLSNTLLEECIVPGVGNFKAFSSGRIRIVFSDRTALDMYADFSKRLGHCKGHSDDKVNSMPDVHSYRHKSQHAHKICDSSEDLPVGLCRLMLPNGHFTTVLLSRPEQYERYIKAAQEWASWVKSSPEEREIFYKDTLHDTSKMQEINKELRKINCFNYIVENTLLAQFESKSSLGVKKSNYQNKVLQTSKKFADKEENQAETSTKGYKSLPNSRTFKDYEVDDVIRENHHVKHSLDSNAGSKIHSSVLNTFKIKHPEVRKKEHDAFIKSISSPLVSNNTPYGFTNVDNQKSGEKSNDRSLKRGEKVVRNSVTGVDLDLTQNTAFNLEMVEQILQKTSQAVSDLDEFLAKA